jgi:hypothetical protein
MLLLRMLFGMTVLLHIAGKYLLMEMAYVLSIYLAMHVAWKLQPIIFTRIHCPVSEFQTKKIIMIGKEE